MRKVASNVVASAKGLQHVSAASCDGNQHPLSGVAQRWFRGLGVHDPRPATASSQCQRTAVSLARSGASKKAPAPTPPTPPRQPEARTAYGFSWTDEYRWMEDGGATLDQHVDAERGFAAAALAGHRRTAVALLSDMLSRLPPETETVPEKYGEYEYWTRQKTAGPRAVLLRRLAAGGSEEVVLDSNLLPEGSELSQVKIGLSGRWLAYTLQSGGGEACSCHVIDLTSGQRLEAGELPSIVSVEWLQDGSSLAYTLPDADGRPHKVMLRHLSRGIPDVCLLEEADPQRFLELSRTKDGAYVAINSNSKTDSEVHLISTQQPEAELMRLAQRQRGVQYFVEHHGSHIFIMTNASCDKFRAGAETASTTSEARLNGATEMPSAAAYHTGPGDRAEDISFSRWSSADWETADSSLPAASSPMRGRPSATYQPGSADRAEDISFSRWSPVDWGANTAAGVRSNSSSYQQQQLPAADQQAGLADRAEDISFSRWSPSDWEAGSTSASGCRDAHIDAAEYRLLRIPLEDGIPNCGAAETALEMEEGSVLQDLDFFRGRLAVWLRRHGKPGIAVAPIDGDGTIGRLEHVTLPPEAAHVSSGLNPDFGAETLRFTAESPFHQERSYDYRFADGLTTLKAVAQLQGDHGFTRLTVSRISATSADGTKVPLTVISRKATPPEGGAPLLLTAYGAYGETLDADFRLERLSLLKRGWTVALAHVRGGGELGRRWHAAGTGANKANSVADLEACLDRLIESGHTSPGLVALEGASAGAIPIANLIQRRPEAVAGAVLRVPFVDMLSTMTRPELPLTAHEYGEWGDAAADPAALAAVADVCPYHNVPAAAPIPPTLIMVAGDDVRVPLWGPLKWAARLRDSRRAWDYRVGQTAGTSPADATSPDAAYSHDMAGGTKGRSAAADGSSSIVVYINQTGGHFGAAQLWYQDAARSYAFLIDAVKRRRSLNSDLTSKNTP